MLSVGSFGRHVKPIIITYLLWVIEITCSVQLNVIKNIIPWGYGLPVNCLNALFGGQRDLLSV